MYSMNFPRKFKQQRASTTEEGGAPNTAQHSIQDISRKIQVLEAQVAHMDKQVSKLLGNGAAFEQAATDADAAFANARGLCSGDNYVVLVMGVNHCGFCNRLKNDINTKPFNQQLAAAFDNELPDIAYLDANKTASKVSSIVPKFNLNMLNKGVPLIMVVRNNALCGSYAGYGGPEHFASEVSKIVKAHKAKAQN
jgi:thioredoxin-related protein